MQSPRAMLGIFFGNMDHSNIEAFMMQAREKEIQACFEYQMAERAYSSFAAYNWASSFGMLHV